MKRDVELISTGSELLSGRTVNRHANVLGKQLRPLGLKLVRDTTVSDEIDDIRDSLRSALGRVDIVMVSGGLGPTQDDVTRDAIAGHLGREVVMHEPSLETMKQRFSRLGRQMTKQSELQTQIVNGAEALSNRVGAAPGERIELDGKVIFILPGPPDEFRAVLDDHVVPWLAEEFQGQEPVESTFMVCGLGESTILKRFDDTGFPPAGVDVAYGAAPGRVEIRLFSRTGNENAVTEAAAQVREILGDYVFAEDRAEMEEVVGRLLAEQGKTLAVAESCTGGLLGSRITSVSGSSAYFLGGVVSYSNEVKDALLGVEPDVLDADGAVSEPVAREMAEGVRERLGADFGLGITGIAGPSGGTEEKPVGLVYIGLADGENVWVRENRFVGDRERVRYWATQIALDMLRRRLRGQAVEGQQV